MIVKMRKVRPDAVLPCYAHPGDAGMDLCACASLTIEPGEVSLVPTGIAIALPGGTEAQVRPRSGLALKHSVTLLNTPGTIDEGYRGEIKVIMINHGKEPFAVEPGMRIAQMVIASYVQARIEEVANLDETSRGAGGFGSTGV